MEILIVVLLLAVVVGVVLALVRTRSRGRRAIDGLEPPPDAPRVTPEMRQAADERVRSIMEADLPDEAPSVEDVIAQARREQSAGDAVPAADEPPPVADAGAAQAVDAEAGGDVAEADEVDEPAPRPRLRDRLAKARAKLAEVVGSMRGGSIGADVGGEPTEALLATLKGQVADQDVTDGTELLELLKAEMKRQLEGHDLELAKVADGPSVWLFVGVNGVGKTTTIGKLAKREVDEGASVVMAAGDTFRAAAAEQLTMWAERTGADIVRGAEGSDPSSVIFDAVESAASKGADLVLADTAGRLHTKTNLMDELAKVRRVADKGAGTVTEVLLVLDATTGQNGLVQAQQFTDAVEVTGVVLTKLDGSAKGGIVFAIQRQLGIPVKLVGLGETAEDLVPFDGDEFVEALLS